MSLHDCTVNYLLVKLSIVIGTLTLLLSTYVAFTNYQSTVRVRLDGHNEMLQTLDVSYIFKLVSENERELEVLIDSLDEKSLSKGENAVNVLWPIAHRIKMEDNHFIYFYHIEDGRIDSYPAWVPRSGFDASERPWFKLLYDNIDSAQWIGPYSEFGSGELVLTLGKKIIDSTGKKLGLLLVDMPLKTIQETLERSLGNIDASLFIRNRDTGVMLSMVNPTLYKAGGMDSVDQHIAFGGLRSGALVLHPLSYVEWQLGLYIPPTRFVTTLKMELSKALFPVCSVALVAWLGVYSLLRVFRQEQKLLLEHLEQIVDVSHTPQNYDERMTSWFVGNSLEEIENIRSKYHANRQKLRLDQLTGILNRRAFEQDRETLRQERSPVTLLLIDLDMFKSINDNFGHQVGDLVLCRVADSLVSIFGLEQVYRIGGDEFAALLPMEMNDIAKKVDSLLHHVRNLRWREYNCRVTLSIGIARGPGDPEKIFVEADVALYKSKRNGRDRWVLA